MAASARLPERVATSPDLWFQPSDTIRMGRGASRYSRAATGVAFTITIVRSAEARPAPIPVRMKLMDLAVPLLRAGLGAHRPQLTRRGFTAGRLVENGPRLGRGPDTSADHVGQEAQEAGALDRLGELALLLGRHGRDARRARSCRARKCSATGASCPCSRSSARSGPRTGTSCADGRRDDVHRRQPPPPPLLAPPLLQMP